MFQYILFHKPYDVLSQFTREIPSHKTLGDYLDVAKDVYPVGRLDRDSEGLLLLTNDPKMNGLLLDPKRKLPKTYLCQLDDDITSDAVEKLGKGVTIKIKSGLYLTLPCQVEKLKTAPLVEDRIPPIRSRKNIPTSWIKMTITEGKNRQVRKMCAAVGFPVLRLIRISIGNMTLDKLRPGEYLNVQTFQ